jgi:hypothetical protein
MRRSLIFLIPILGLCLGSPRAQSIPPTAAVDFAKKAVPRALDYDQGSRESLMDAKEDFTPDGWREFMNWLNGYVNEKGAPTGSSLFVATGEATVRNQENGTIRLVIPGTLKQQSKNEGGGIMAATYHVAIDVELGGNLLKIQHLKVTTCGAKPCDQ